MLTLVFALDPCLEATLETPAETIGGDLPRLDDLLEKLLDDPTVAFDGFELELLTDEL